MRRIKIESGRSMLEVIAVLIIIGLLTAGGLVGYSYLIQRYRQQESVKEVAELVLGVKTAALARRHEDGVTIAAREVVQGPKMNASGEVIRLPEGENSYVVVTNLAGGAFAVNLQVEKGTCQALLEALKNEDITMFEPSKKPVREGTIADVAKDWAQGSKTTQLMGVKYNVKETEEDKKLVDSSKGAALRKKIMDACEGDSDGLGRAAWVFDCSKGSSSYGYLYDLFCSGCPVGSMRDATGKCCSYSSNDRCGNLCSCPQGTMCDPEKNQCVECTTVPTQEIGNAQCKNVYPRVWQRHVCDGTTNRCVECIGDNDCRDSRQGYDNPYADVRAEYCLEKHCVECNANYGVARTATVIPCPESRPLCSSGTCTTCPEGQEWRDGECKCTDGLVKNAAGECVLCVDNAMGHGTDRGCNEGDFVGKPICSDQEGTNSFGRGGTENSGTTCYECIIDENCALNPSKKYCSANFTCVACDGAWDSTNRVCRTCQDNNSQDLKDKACEDGTLGTAKRLCKPDNSNENGSGLFGDACYVCRNNNYGDNNGMKDDGCSSENKLCNSDPGTYGNKCEFCQNDHGGKDRDSGCDKDTDLPLCVAGENAYGTSCAKCINDNDGNDTDTGCDKDEPMCQADSGEYGTDCRSCPTETPIWSEKANNGAGACVACIDSIEDEKTDTGCDGDKPICVTATKKNDGTNDPGNSCAVCQNNKPNAEQDTNCPETQPMCQAGDQEFGNQCKSCAEVDANKPEMKDGVCATCFDTATSTTTDQGCGGNGKWKDKPMCGNTANNGQGSAGTACFKCYDSVSGDGQDAGCPKESPVCVVENGKFGNTCEKPCSGSDKCVNTAGQCIAVRSFDDIVRGADGKCQCLAAVRTQEVNDQGHSYHPGDGWDKTCERRSSSRQRLYSIPVNFYCPRYMHVSDSSQADDFVAGSNPAGIGVTSPAVKSASWKYAHTNDISPRVSSGTIQRGTATLTVQDRWLGEVGFYRGFFYFTTQKGEPSAGPQKLTAHAGWAQGSTQSNKIGGWLKKDGQKGCDGSGDNGGSGGGGGSTCFYDPSAKHGNCKWPSGRTQLTHCFTRVWAASATPKAKCSISGDKHTVTARGGMCNANFYEGRNCR